MTFSVRPGTADDVRFIVDMLVEAANWDPMHRQPRVAVLADPMVAHYISGWPRPSDRALIAIDGDETPIGACWFRIFPRNSPGYGWVASGVPELGLGVSPVWRAQGVGRELLRQTLALAASLGHQRLSLSVERANYAQRLYQSEGFVVVSSGENADTMVKALL
jgi:GNAT superfamily N-acetyltransferase